MIAGKIHQGSGIGNQLHRYVAVRTLALDKGYKFGFQGASNFKGNEFMKLDMGEQVDFEGGQVGFAHEFEEKKVIENGVDIRGYDPEFNFIEDNTLIDGEFQDERYFEHHLPEIRQWMKAEPLEMDDNLCVINFRGGEFSIYPDLFLPIGYWNQAIGMMRDKYPFMRFEVHTDDPLTARQFFPDLKVWDNQMITSDKRYSNIGFNWRSIRYAKHLILANSSFGILPALLNEDVKEVIAPRYWARHNTCQWALSQNYYKKFTYI